MSWFLRTIQWGDFSINAIYLNRKCEIPSYKFYLNGNLADGWKPSFLCFGENNQAFSYEFTGSLFKKKEELSFPGKVFVVRRIDLNQDGFPELSIGRKGAQNQIYLHDKQGAVCEMHPLRQGGWAYLGKLFC